MNPGGGWARRKRLSVHVHRGDCFVTMGLF